MEKLEEMVSTAKELGEKLNDLLSNYELITVYGVLSMAITNVLHGIKMTPERYCLILKKSMEEYDKRKNEPTE